MSARGSFGQKRVVPRKPKLSSLAKWAGDESFFVGAKNFSPDPGAWKAMLNNEERCQENG